jgi:hypothetical protein
VVLEQVCAGVCRDYVQGCVSWSAGAGFAAFVVWVSWEDGDQTILELGFVAEGLAGWLFTLPPFAIRLRRMGHPAPGAFFLIPTTAEKTSAA